MYQELPTKKRQELLSAEDVLQRLVKGNNRFVAHLAQDYDTEARKRCLQEHGQAPVVAVLSCVDSRKVPETVFDAGIGDIASFRIPGNVASPDMVAGLCFGVEALGPKLIVVLGHSQCGAVASVVEDKTFSDEAMQALSHINTCGYSGKEAELRNVRQAVKALKGVPSISDSDVLVVGAYLDLITRQVEFLQ